MKRIPGFQCFPDSVGTLYLLALVQQPFKPSRMLCSMEQPTQPNTGGDKLFQTADPVLWNKLPPHTWSLALLQSFKELFKLYLFKLEYKC